MTQAPQHVDREGFVRQLTGMPAGKVLSGGFIILFYFAALFGAGVMFRYWMRTGSLHFLFITASILIGMLVNTHFLMEGIRE